MLYLPALCKGFAQSIPDPSLLGSPASAPGFSFSQCATKPLPMVNIVSFAVKRGAQIM